MSLKLLGVLYHLHFTAQQSNVPDLSCTPSKMASLLVSFQAITRSRLHCFAPAQFLRVPHHPGCIVKSYGTLLQFWLVFRPIRQRPGGDSHAKVGLHGRSVDFLS